MVDITNPILASKRILQYPLNLGSSDIDDHGNPAQYMMFKIMIDEQATKLREDKSAGAVVSSTRVGIGASTERINLKENEKDADPDLKIQYGSEAVGAESWRYQKGMQRLDKVVVLPMPNQHNVGTTIRYSEEEQTGLSKLGDIYNQLGNGVVGEAATWGKNAGISAILNKLKNGITNTNALLAEERLALNPKKEVLFKDMGFRQFSFQYNFAPKSQEESEMVDRIIETFRYYASPELSPSKFFFMLPAEFDVSFMLGHKHNPHIPKIATSVLQRVGVNYSPNSGVWATLPNGAPVAIDMTLEFMELEIITRERIFNANSPITMGH